MTAREPHPTQHYLTLIAIVAAVAGIFAADLLTPPRVAVWLFYFFPIVLCLLTRQAALSLFVAAACSLLLIAGLISATEGPTGWISEVNRVMGLVLVWGVAIAVRQMIASRQALKRHAWLRETQAAFSEVVRGDPTQRALARRMLRFLVTQLGAQAGALYAVEDGELVLVAAQGTDDERGPRERIALNDTLLGEAVHVARPQLVRHLPPEYFTIASGLGRGAAGALIFAPATADGELIGIAELGYYAPVGEENLELLQQLAEPMGSALHTAQLRTHRAALLRETQKQAEELIAQQEELRVSNEELQQHSENLRHSQQQLERQQSELEQTNVLLEERSELLARQNEALLEARATLADKAHELERASQYKSEFLANMSHELRTPLNSTLILAKLLADNRQRNLTDEQVRFANTIYSSGNDLLELINDILDLSKVETGNVDITADDVEIAAMVHGVVQGVEPLARAKGIACELHVQDAPASIRSDAQRVRQILKNLMSNAVKFTERGGVSMTVSGSGDGGVRFAVQDTGIGIATEHRETIFEPFRQADGTTNRKYGGTGLGLSISRQLAQLLGGHIELQSEVGHGSTFTLVLPAATPSGRRQMPQAAADAEAPARPLPAPSPVPPAPPAPPPRPKVASAPQPADDRDALDPSRRQLLIVEDDGAFADTVARVARDAGFQCLIAGTADEGIELALKHRPAAIVLDIGLPDHTGLSVLDRLKHNPDTRHIPVQVVSAEDHRRPALDMGAAGVMLKPVQLDELVGALKTLENRSSGGPRTILVVEDDAVQRDSICQLLDELDVRTVAVATVGEALGQLGASTFDCMVMDLNLPDASGYQLLETMAQEERYGFPPVIVYTGRSITRDEEQQLRRYSQSIILKGAKSPERLLDEVTLFLHQVETRLPPDRQRMLADARSREQAFEGRRILLVEDDVRNIFALTRVLEPSGAELLIARNGREAVEQLASQPRVDLILMDIMMPEMDGLEATRRIRDLPDARARTPIIALTAKAMPDDQQRCLQAGANDYVSKPIDIDKLMSLMRVWLPR